MIITCEDVNGYVDHVLEEYHPSDVTSVKKAVAEELNALQQFYFTSFCKKEKTSDFSYEGNPLLSVGTRLISEDNTFYDEDVLAVFLDEEELPLLKKGEFLRKKYDACTVLDGMLELRIKKAPQVVTVLMRDRPPKIHLLYDGTIIGALCIPEEHFPLVIYKMRESILRLMGEYEGASYYGALFDNFARELEAKEEKSKRATV